jgi:leader peptidase (prepilin peptidase)/N-methyltransferase
MNVGRQHVGNAIGYNKSVGLPTPSTELSAMVLPSVSPIALALVLCGSIGAGAAAAWIAQMLAETKRTILAPMIGLSMLLGVWASLIIPQGSLFVVTCALGWTLLVLSAVDALVFRLPDILTLPLLAAGLTVAWWLPGGDLVGHLIAALAALALLYVVSFGYRRLRGREGLGLGDVKLAGAAGAWVGWQGVPSVILLASCAGMLWVGIGIMRRGRKALEERIPFGVALSFAIWIVWLYGPLELFGPVD